jgi:hypothetical protein
MHHLMIMVSSVRAIQEARRQPPIMVCGNSFLLVRGVYSNLSEAVTARAAIHRCSLGSYLRSSRTVTADSKRWSTVSESMWPRQRRTCHRRESPELFNP